MARILLVDDEPAIRDNLTRYLVALGHDVRSASDGKQAMASIDEVTPDLLITDINMPDMDGIEILRALRDKGPRLPVIAISGGGRIDRDLLLGSAALLGAVVTLEKPFELSALGRAVARVLETGTPDTQATG